MKYRVEAEFRYKGYIEVEAPNEDAAWDIAENTDGGEFEEMPETSGWEIEKPKLIGIEIKGIYVDDFGIRSIAKESDLDAAVESGYDDSIFFYVPDDVFTKSDTEIKEYVEKNVISRVI